MDRAQNHAYSYLCYMQKLQRDGVVASLDSDINDIPASKREHAVRLLDTVLQATRDVNMALECINYSKGDIYE